MRESRLQTLVGGTVVGGHVLLDERSHSHAVVREVLPGRVMGFVLAIFPPVVTPTEAATAFRNGQARLRKPLVALFPLRW